jgi:hypothetical protein
MGDPAMSGESGGRCERAISTMDQYASSGVSRQHFVALRWFFSDLWHKNQDVTN